MPILAITTDVAGLVGVKPRVIYIDTNDTLAVVTTAGYLNKVVQEGAIISEEDIAIVSTRTTPASTTISLAWLQVNKTGQNWSLIPAVSPGSVTLPTIANHLIVSTNTTGQLANLTGTAINNGSLQAGLSGTAGTLISYPATASKGSLIVAATANTGNTNVTITNAAFGQASVLTLPDPAGAAAEFVLAPAALVNNNLVKASGTAGLIADAGIATSNVMVLNASNVLTGSGQITLVKANGVEAANAVTASGNAGVITTSSLNTAGGANYAITWTNTKITSTSVFAFCIQGGTNTTQNITFTCAPGSGTATLTIYNNTAATALNGTILIGYTVL